MDEKIWARKVDQGCLSQSQLFDPSRWYGLSDFTKQISTVWLCSPSNLEDLWGVVSLANVLLLSQAISASIYCNSDLVQETVLWGNRSSVLPLFQNRLCRDGALCLFKMPSHVAAY